MLSEKLETILRDELHAGERLLWSGQPRPLRLARAKIPVSVFGLFFGGFAAFWMAGASGFKLPNFNAIGFETIFPLFGLPFLFAGLGMITSPIWAARKAAKIIYAITSKRALIITPKTFGGVEIRAFDPDKLKDIRRVQLSDGKGDLIFSEDILRGEDGNTRIGIGFLSIPEVREAERILRKMRDEILSTK